MFRVVVIQFSYCLDLRKRICLRFVSETSLISLFLKKFHFDTGGLTERRRLMGISS